MSINVYLAAELELKRGLAHLLLEKGIVDLCISNCLPWTKYPKHDGIIPIDHGPSLFEEYDRVCNLNSLPAVSKDLMERMLPYETTVIKMGCRRHDCPTAEYEEEKRKYLQHLRYWNHVIDMYGINLIIMGGYPHSPGSFVVYGLARVRGIPFLMWSQQDTFLNRLVWGDSIENIGVNIAERYTDICKRGVDDFVLDEDIITGYDNACRKPDNAAVSNFNKKKRGKFGDFRKRQLSDRKKDYRKDFVRTIAKSIVKTGSLELYEKRAVWFRICRRNFAAYRYYKRHSEMLIDQYDRKFAINADVSQKYILFLPQVQPEASTLPQAGVFAEQYNSIQLLARAAQKTGVLVYVKEHPHSPGRSKDFYDEIRFIDNVRLIKSSESTYELMKHSIGISTQTGTCVWEAVGMKKPVFVFSSGYFWKRCPGVYEIVDEDQGASVIKNAIDGIDIKDEDIRRYLYAIQLETIKEITPAEMDVYAMHPGGVAPVVDLGDRVELIKRFISEHSIGTQQ